MTTWNGLRWIAPMSLLVIGTASSQTLDDYRKAASAKGCDTIPYESLRKDCRSKGEDVFAYCKTEESGCAGLDTYSVQRTIDAAQKDIADLERNRDGARSKRDAAKDDAEKKQAEDEVSRVERSLEEKKRLIEEQRKVSDDYKYQARGRIEKAQRCRESRIDVVEIFDAATRKAQAESDAEIKQAVAGSLAKFEEEEQGHTRQIKEVQERLLRCEKAAKGEPLN